MSLRLLAGPFNLTDDVGVALTPHTVNPICHYPGFGLVMKIGFASVGKDELALVTLDGIAEPLTTSDIGGAGGFNAAKWRFDLVTGELVTNSGNAREKVCLCQVPYVGQHDISSGGFSAMACMTADRSLFVFAGGFTNTGGPEADFPSGVSMSTANILPGRTSTEVYVGQVQTTGSTDNRGLFYDTATRQFTTQGFHLGDGILASYWDVDSGVLVTITDTPQYQFRIYSLDVIPSALSSVTLKSGAVAKGSVATFEVQVQGDKGDWSVGVLVDWSIFSGDGVLLDTQSTTGADGYATARVFYPTSASVSTVLKAGVTY